MSTAGHSSVALAPDPDFDTRANTFVAGLNDAVLLVLVVLLFPLAILLIGAPFAFVVRVLIEIARRL